MAKEKVDLKSGMAGSSAGRERSAKTGQLKRASKKARRRQGKHRAFEERYQRSQQRSKSGKETS